LVDIPRGSAAYTARLRRSGRAPWQALSIVAPPLPPAPTAKVAAPLTVSEVSPLLGSWSNT